jgi:hypothetical protein
MKKIYISICALAISVSAIAQVASQNITPIKYSKDLPQEHIVANNQVISANNANSNAMQNVIWESDFSDPSDWVLDNSNGGGGAFGWTIDAISDSWYYGGATPAISINSTSGGNFAELSNGDPFAGTQLLNVEYTLTTSQPIDVLGTIGSTDAILSFEEFGARFNDLQAIQVSTDGVNFTTVADNLNYQVLAQAGGSSYPNPSLREVMLAPHISANASSVWIRFSWTTNYPTQATNPNVWVTYGWYIDDVKIYEAPDNAISMTEEVIGGWWIEYLNTGGIGQDYTFNPISQATANPYAFEAVISNEGTVSQDIIMYAEVFDDVGNSVFNTSSNIISLSPATQDTFFCTSLFTPANTGFYEIRMWSVADSLGLGALATYSDTALKSSIVTGPGTQWNNVYGKDYNQDFGYRYLNDLTYGYESASTYHMYADEILYSVNAQISDWSVPGAQVFVKLYEEDPAGGDPILLDQSDPYIIDIDDLGAWITIPFLSPNQLLAGTPYRISIGSYIHPTDSVGVNASVGDGSYSSQSWFDTDNSNANANSTWYSTSFIPMLRMNFDSGSATALSDVKHTVFNTFPNPTNGIFTIELESNTKYDVTVNNVLGQTVISTTTNVMNTTIDLSSFDKGVYTVELKNNSSTYVERVIVE